MGSTMIIMHFPESQVIGAFLRVCKAEGLKQLLVVCPMAALNDPILPGPALLAGPMNEPQCSHGPLEGREALRMSCVFHRKSHGIVGPNEKKEGRCSKPRRKTWATVSLRISA
jgi:hypothetical protein